MQDIKSLLHEMHSQHDQLNKLLSDLKTDCDDGCNKVDGRCDPECPETPVLIKKIADVLSFTEYHFAEEEKLMVELDYFDYDGHKETHAVFIRMSTELYNTLLIDPSYLPDVIRILTNWFSTHIEIESFLFDRAAARAGVNVSYAQGL